MIPKASEASMKTFNSFFSIVQWGGGGKSLLVSPLV
jgi:hypothetical protein